MSSSSILANVGQVAGIGGIALGVLLLIFRDVIRKNIFPRIGQVQAYRIIRLIVVFTFVVAALGIVGWVYLEGDRRPTLPPVEFPQQSVDAAVRTHLSLVDSGEYASAWNLMAAEGKKRFPLDTVLKLFESQRRPLGGVKNRQLQNYSPLQQLPDGTTGAFGATSYVSEFESGDRLLEVVTTIAEDGVWRVIFHQYFRCTEQLCGV